MENENEHQTTLVGITGESNDCLHILANLYYEPVDPESVLSVVVRLAHKPDVKGNVIYSTETWCTSMDQSPGGGLFVVSMEGELHVFRQGAWRLLNLDCPSGLNSVWVATDNEAFAVGLKGERARIVGETVELVRDAEGRRLNCVHGSGPRNVFAVGDGGLIFRFDGVVWEELPALTESNLLTVLCKSEKEVYVGGAGGVLLHWNGVRWNVIRIAGIAEITITSIAFYRDTLYAAVGRAGVYVLRENVLEPIKDEVLYRLRSIDDLLFGIGNRLVLQYDGESWWGGDLDL